MVYANGKWQADRTTATKIVAANDSQNKEKADYKAVPCGIFTNPEIATVGLSEEEARKNYSDIIIKKFDFRSLGMSYVIDETDGFIKIIADKEENIIGGSIIGPRATELIHILTIIDIYCKVMHTLRPGYICYILAIV